MSVDTTGSAHLALANRFVDEANRMMAEGEEPEALGLAMTHAAANFTAFAGFLNDATTEELDNVADEYRRLLHAYVAARRES